MGIQIKRFAAIFFFSLCMFQTLAHENKPPRGIPIKETPLKVQMGFNLTDITDISEKQETIDFDGALYLNWMDSSLAYDKFDAGMPDFVPGDYSHASKKIFQGDFAVKELFDGWRPYVIIPNGIGNRVVSNMTINIWPDGKVEYSETFYAKVETPMDLRMFPFDKHALEIYFHPINYKRDELILVPDNHLGRQWGKNTGIAEWTQGGITMKESPSEIAYFDDSKDIISEFSITLIIKRKPLHVLVSIILPLLILVSLTWCVFWIDEGEAVFGRVNILFIGILSVIAYYLIIQDNIPKISYLTLIDAFMLSTFFLLAAGVIITIIVQYLNRIGSREIGNRVDRICRWAFPVAYILLTLLSGTLI